MRKAFRRSPRFLRAPQRALRFALTCAVAALLGALCLHAQTNLTGAWVLKTPRGDGSLRESFFELKQTGETITGRKVNLFGRVGTSISNGTLRNGKLHFAVAAPKRNASAQPASAVILYDGVPANGSFLLTATGAPQEPGEPTTGTFETTARLARQPLPPLRDLPNSGLAPTPPMGWNSWNRFADDIDDKTVRAIADAMVSSGMKQAGYQYVNLDDTWEGERDADGNITSNNKFPDMKALADYVHSRGLKIGIYSTPGPRTCEGYEGSLGHEQQDARTFASWGFDYLKYDWCTASGIYDDTEAQAVFQKMGEALAASGRPMVYSLSYSIFEIWRVGPKVGADLWRTSDDIRNNWQAVDQIGFGPRVPKAPGQPGKPRPLGLTQYDIASASAIGRWNDPDILEVGNEIGSAPLTADESRAHFSLWCLLRAPLLAGNDLRQMTDETKSILTNTEAIAVDQDPAALPLKRITQSKTSVVYMRPLHDGSIAVALFNRGPSAAEINVTWNSLGLAGKNLEARDLWQHQPVAVRKNGYSATVPSHGVVLLRVKSR